jgi:hypothetical protein
VEQNHNPETDTHQINNKSNKDRSQKIHGAKHIFHSTTD